jgi:hypothetical protein
MLKNRKGIIPIREAIISELKKVGRFHLGPGFSMINPEKYIVKPMHKREITMDSNSFSTVQSSGSEKYLMHLRSLTNPYKVMATIVKYIATVIT